MLEYFNLQSRIISDVNIAGRKTMRTTPVGINASQNATSNDRKQHKTKHDYNALSKKRVSKKSVPHERYLDRRAVRKFASEVAEATSKHMFKP